ncbi:hypothetical protein PHSY_005222 [Pseudozyma hubeiensis SY62]|uniref:Uncharacterized protein n=1 Tax=Pseudozyma hubeiensis (strain SY62) TaxID=1305764 RepID=R9P8D7_PSEHS|nr:hypothetical protein PHSY_005222 [Pseudozyma hubeiensis SY62]GAC97636.1 hypothetical protein PHSY_005222 [Pseudozyma hubeiensis SY62]
MSGEDRWSKASSSRASAGSSSSISSSFLGLKAELERSKATSSSLASSSSKRKPDDLDRPSRRKLSSAFLAPPSSDKDKRLKAATDHSSSSKRSSSSSSSSNEPSTSQLERIKHNLERKARIYSQLESGKFGGFTSAELKEGSIDWDRKRSQPPIRALTPSPPLIEDRDERQVEYVDEFGRTRRSKLSEVPRELLPKEYGGDLEEEDEGQEEDNAIYGPSTSFPVYNPEVHRRERYAKEEEARGKRHFDPDFDRRHRGAAFYRFSDKEDERKVQLDQLAELRNETRRNRSEIE